MQPSRQVPELHGKRIFIHADPRKRPTIAGHHPKLQKAIGHGRGRFTQCLPEVDGTAPRPDVVEAWPDHTAAPPTV